MEQTFETLAQVPEEHSEERYYPDPSAEAQSESAPDGESYEVPVIEAGELDFEELQQELQAEDSVVRVVLQKEQQNSGNNLRNGNCCFMRTNAWLYSNGTFAADTYMNHYCMIGKFTARTIVKVMAGGRVLATFRSGEHTTAGERQDTWGDVVKIHTPEYINQHATHLDIYHEVTYNGW